MAFSLLVMLYVAEANIKATNNKIRNCGVSHFFLKIILLFSLVFVESIARDGPPTFQNHTSHMNTSTTKNPHE